MARLELRGVTRTYPGGIAAASSVDLTVEDGELFVIVGPSGSGKSTLLRLIAGLEALDLGSILLDGRRIDDLAPVDRDLAMVFQDQVLYPHLNVFENLAFGLRARKVSKTEVNDRVRGTASLLGLADCLTRSPGTLSGGQRRRVSLGRAMVLRPKLFLFDEPFSGLDAPLRASTRAELVDLNRKLGATMVLVTHDQGEALALGHRVAVIDQGLVVQVGRPLDLYDRPACRFVARFLGQPTMNLLPGRFTQIGQELAIRFDQLDDLDPWPISWDDPRASSFKNGGSARIEMGIRPENVRVHAATAKPLSTGSQFPLVSAIVRRVEPTGHETLAYLDFGLHQLAARLPARAPHQVGDRVFVELDIDRAIWFDVETGERLD